MVGTSVLHFVVVACSIPFYMVGLIGNVLVIRIVHKTHEMHTPTNYLLASMTLSDVITTVFLPAYVLATNNITDFSYNFGKVTCKFFALAGICIKVSSTTLAVLAVERYHALLKPFRTELRLNDDNVKKAIAIIWVLNILLSLPEFFFQEWSNFVGRSTCVGPWNLHLMNQASKIYVIVLAAIFFIQVTTTCYCYASLIK